MKLSVWAQRQGLTYGAVWRMWKHGKLPVKATQLPTGTIIVDDTPAEAGVALYARVSSHDQKTEMEAQLGRLAVYAAAHELKVVKTVAEVGSGLNGHRKGLLKLLADPKVRTVVVEHRDRLLRFGSEYVEAALAADGRKLVVVDAAELKDDLVQDLIAVLTSMGARLYGRRSARNRAKRALALIQQPNDHD